MILSKFALPLAVTVALLGSGFEAHATTPQLSITAGRSSSASSDDLTQLESRLRTALAGNHTSAPTNIEVVKVAFRPGGTAAALRQLGGHDAARVTVTSAAGSQTFVVRSRSEGMLDTSASARRSRLWTSVAHAIATR